MYEIFSGLYDQIFIQDIKNIYDGGKISDLTKRFLEGNATIAEKKYFVKLKNNYFKIKGIKDYDLIQKKLYGSQSRSEIILLELTRILNNSAINTKISEQVSDIEKLLNIHKNEIDDKTYERIINLIIKIEISLGIRIGLFNELCNLFENEVAKIDRELIVDTLTYNKKK